MDLCVSNALGSQSGKMTCPSYGSNPWNKIYYGNAPALCHGLGNRYSSNRITILSVPILQVLQPVGIQQILTSLSEYS